MIVHTTKLQSAKELAGQYASRNQSKVYLFAVHSGDHRLLWFEMYLEGDQNIAIYWKGTQPVAIVPEVEPTSPHSVA